MPVLASNSIILNGITYKLANADVFERSIDQFPAKIVIGDKRLRDQSLASEWIFVGDLTDGAGIRYHDPAIHQRRFWLARAIDTRWKNRIVLGPQVTQISTDVPADAPVWMEHFVEDDVVIMITPTKIRRHTGSGNWLVPTTPASGTISGGISGAQYKSAFFAAAGGSYWYSTDGGDNWTESNFVNDDARYFCVFDSRLVRIDASGNIYWSTFDHTGAPAASNWTAKGASLPNQTINGMLLWRDAAGRPAIFIATTRGIYIYDWDADRIYEWYVWTYGDTYHAYRMAVWNQDLYVADNRSLLRFSESGLTNVGPDKEDGLDVHNGRIRWLVPLQNWLLVAIDTAGITTRTASIWAYNGRGWHAIALATATNADISAMAYRSTRLFFSSGVTSQYLDIADSSEHPKEISTSLYFARTNGTLAQSYLQTSFFDGGLANIDKNVLAVVIEVLGIDNATEVVQVFYAVNGSSTYNQLGTNITANGQTTLNFGTGSIGEVIRGISFRVRLTATQGTLTPGTTDLRSPIVVSAKLRYMEVPSQLYANTFAVDLRGGQGNEAMTQRANLITAKNSQTLVVLQLGNPTQSITGRVSQLQGVRNDKNQRVPGVYNVTFVQPV